jgi:hypothetical protein
MHEKADGILSHIPIVLVLGALSHRLFVDSGVFRPNPLSNSGENGIF